jgi:protein-S-isoprenylcysteine O-methyltransferase Ste14
MLSIFGLIALLYLNGSIESEYFFPNEGVMRYISLIFTAFGVILIQLAFRQYSLKAFLGLEQEKDGLLQTEGILKSVRHPIYSGIVLIVIGFFVFIPNLPTLISCLCIFGYLPIGIYLEEQKLIKHYGESYLKYKKQVPALIPRTLKF